MVVPDATKDDRFSDNPLVTSGPDIRFYAGVPLTTSDGHHLGTLCVIDHEPRELCSEQLGAIKTLADNIMAHLDLRLSHKQARQYVDDLQLAAAIFDSASEAMIVTDADNLIIAINTAFTITTGYTMSDVKNKNPSILTSGRQSKEFYQNMWQKLNTAGHWHGELWNKRKNGETYAESLSINIIYNEDRSKRLHIAIFSDITEKKRADELILRQANYDQLTQLPNPMLFRDRLENKIKVAYRTGTSMALFSINLDHFKEVNDTLGLDAGDKLLVHAASRISHCLREIDTVARMAGDEFNVILTPMANHEYSGKIAEKIIKSLSQPIIVDDVELTVSASIGIAFFPEDGTSAEQLLKSANIAMYKAKDAGRGRFCYLSGEK